MSSPIYPKYQISQVEAEGSKEIKKGRKAERLEVNSLKEQGCYRIAVQTLKPGEENQAFRGFRGWVKSFFWKPLTIKNAEGSQQTILININSAVNRLRGLGFSQEDVLRKIDQGTLLESLIDKGIDQKVLTRFPDSGSFAFILRGWIQRGELDERDVDQFLQNIKDKVPDDKAEKFAEKLLFDKACRAKGVTPEKGEEEIIKKIMCNNYSSFSKAIDQFKEEKLAYEDAIRELSADISPPFGEMRAFKTEKNANSYPKTVEYLKKEWAEYQELVQKESLSSQEAPPFLTVFGLKRKKLDLNIIISESKQNIFREKAQAKGWSGSDLSLVCFQQIDEMRMRHQGSFEQAIQKVQEYKDQFKRFKCSVQEACLIPKYASTLKCTPEIAYDAISKMNSQGLNPTQILTIVDFVKIKQDEWKKTSKDQAPIKYKKDNWRHRQFGISHSLQYNPADQSIHILFNKFGKGAFKSAQLTMDLATAKNDVRLIQKYQKDAEKEMAQSEYALAAKLSKHPGIAKVHKLTQVELKPQGGKQGKVTFMMDFYNGGDLNAAFYPYTDNKPEPTREEKMLIAKTLLEGLDSMHNKEGIMHRDIKPANVLCKRDPVTKKIIEVGIADFGLACDKQDNQKRNGWAGTPIYMAPEQYKALQSAKSEEIIKSNDFAVDNWAAGIMLYQLFKSEIPEWKALPDEPAWFNESKTGIKNHLVALDSKWLPKPQDPHSIGHVIRGLLKPDPKGRLKAKEALDMLTGIEKGASHDIRSFFSRLMS